MCRKNLNFSPTIFHQVSNIVTVPIFKSNLHYALHFNLCQCLCEHHKGRNTVRINLVFCSLCDCISNPFFSSQKSSAAPLSLLHELEGTANSTLTHAAGTSLHYTPPPNAPLHPPKIITNP